MFCASDSKAHEEMRQACFDYLALGGVYSGERHSVWLAGLDAPHRNKVCFDYPGTGRRLCSWLLGPGRLLRVLFTIAAACSAAPDLPRMCAASLCTDQHGWTPALTSTAGPLLHSPSAAGPVSLLSGLNPRPSVLVMHFFMVALFGVGRWADRRASPRVHGTSTRPRTDLPVAACSAMHSFK